jgi:hypothetical protein
MTKTTYCFPDDNNKKENNNNNQVYRRYLHYSIDDLLEERNRLIKLKVYHSDVDLELVRRSQEY